jgi:hypothetical protein
MKAHKKELINKRDKEMNILQNELKLKKTIEDKIKNMEKNVIIGGEAIEKANKLKAKEHREQQLKLKKQKLKENKLIKEKHKKDEE